MTRKFLPVILRGSGALDQVIAVDGGRHLCFRQAGGNKLQHCHLCRRILHRHAVCSDTKWQEA